MHALTLITILPFLLLFAAVGLVALLLVATALVEFPWIVLVAAAIAALGHHLSGLNKRHQSPCKQA